MSRAAPVATMPLHHVARPIVPGSNRRGLALGLALLLTGTAHDLSAAAVSSSRAATDGVAALPRFSFIAGWEDSLRSGPSDAPPQGATSGQFPTPEHPASDALFDLCRFYGLSFSTASIWAACRSPLEWPAILQKPKINPRRRRLEITSLLSANGLANRELSALEPAQIADSIKAAVAGGCPVIVNAPGVPIVFGYDDREPDPWWWVSSDGQEELILESERLARLVYWDDDPAAGVCWVVTGVDSVGPHAAGQRANDYEFLHHISQSARGDPVNGIVPYPLSIRDLRDRLAQSQSPVFPTDAATPSDPFGIHRAALAREQLLAVLKRLTQSEPDTNLSAPLRLALYCIHNDLAVLQRLADSLYGDPIGLNPDRLPVDHIDSKRRLAAAGMFTDLLRWEKQMVEQIDRALLVYDANQTPPQKPAPAKKPGRRRR